MLNPQLPLVDADGDASLSFSFRTDTLTVAGQYTVCAEYVETRDHLTRASSLAQMVLQVIAARQTRTETAAHCHG